MWKSSTPISHVGVAKLVEVVSARHSSRCHAEVGAFDFMMCQSFEHLSPMVTFVVNILHTDPA